MLEYAASYDAKSLVLKPILDCRDSYTNKIRMRKIKVIKPRKMCDFWTGTAVGPLVKILMHKLSLSIKSAINN